MLKFFLACLGPVTRIFLREQSYICLLSIWNVFCWCVSVYDLRLPHWKWSLSRIEISILERIPKWNVVCGFIGDMLSLDWIINSCLNSQMPSYELTPLEISSSEMSKFNFHTSLPCRNKLKHLTMWTMLHSKHISSYIIISERLSGD